MGADTAAATTTRFAPGTQNPDRPPPPALSWRARRNWLCEVRQTRGALRGSSTHSGEVRRRARRAGAAATGMTYDLARRRQVKPPGGGPFPLVHSASSNPKDSTQSGSVRMPHAGDLRTPTTVFGPRRELGSNKGTRMVASKIHRCPNGVMSRVNPAVPAASSVATQSARTPNPTHGRRGVPVKLLELSQRQCKLNGRTF